MADVSTVPQKISYPWPTSEVFQLIANRIQNPIVTAHITNLNISWCPRESDFMKLTKVAKRSKDAVKTILYIAKDARTPDVFMEPNGPTLIAYSEVIDGIAKYDKHTPYQGIDNLARAYMLPGFEATYCDSCDRIFINSDDITSSKTIADYYDLELKERKKLCPFEFMSLCAEIEYLYPDINTPRKIPTLPDGRPVIWIGDPAWGKYPEEYRKLSLKYQGNY